VTDPKWLAQLADEPTGKFPSCDDGVDLHDQRFVGAMVATVEAAQRPEIVNVALERCDIAGFVAEHGRADRVVLAESRLRGVTWANGVIRDVRFIGVTAAETSFRFSELRRVVFRDCKLPAIDFTRATFDDVRFESCELVGAIFDHARISGPVRIEHCDLTHCSGAEALAGASIHPDNLLTFAPSMAQALGFTIE
jgi:uncharacterized protein YjbI with pentapeptide repeats